MKVKVEIEFDSEAEAVAYLGTKAITGKITDHRAMAEVPAQTYEPVTTPLSAAEKAKATKAANAAKKAAEAPVMPSQPSSIPTGAFPSAPSQPLNPIQMPGVPAGMPMPSGLPPVNYGAPMQAPAPQVQAPAQNYAPPVQQAPAAPQQWDRVAVINGVQAAAEKLGQPREAIQALFGSIFQENGITPAPVGQLTDQDLYKFQTSFYAKIQNPNHLV